MAPVLRASEVGAPRLLAQSGPAQPVLTFPLKAVKVVKFSNLGHMQTEISLSKQGQLRGYNRTWSDPGNPGFKAAVSVALTDMEGNVVFVSKTREYGVGSGDSQSRSWREDVPAEQVSRVGGYIIYQVFPPDQLSKDWVTTPEGQRIVKAKYSTFRP